MIVGKAKKRSDGKSSFLTLLAYTTIRDENEHDVAIDEETPKVRSSQSKEAIFQHLMGYLHRHGNADKCFIKKRFADGRHQVLFDNVLCETNTMSVATAAVEMQAVALKNTRCKDPVYHFFLSWPESDSPTVEQVFESARHSLNGLGMSEHQYVTAIHRDTHHLHCHVAVNRIHPVTYKAGSDAYDISKLHKASREMELKYGWEKTKGCYVINENNQIVRSYSQKKSMPDKAKKLEYYSDKESLYHYVNRECREEISEVLKSDVIYWERIHAVLIKAGLELKKKGKGLGIYDRAHPEKTPLKASSLHPHLTLSYLEPRAGEFAGSPKVDTYDKDRLVFGYVMEKNYDEGCHARDQSARQERRVARAKAREDLKTRYQAYKKAWVAPSFDAKNRFKTVAIQFRFRRAHVRVSQPDPLIRKLTYHVLAFEREKAMAELRLQLKQERGLWYSDSKNRRWSYRAWVEQQALKGDKAALSQLRGWAYKIKRDNRTAELSDTVIECAQGDDIPVCHIRGYTAHLNRDGAILYKKDGITQIVDRGERIEVSRPFEDGGETLLTALSLAHHKSGEKRSFSGPAEYVKQACALVKDFNAGSETRLTLTDPVQQRWASEVRFEDKNPSVSFSPSPHFDP